AMSIPYSRNKNSKVWVVDASGGKALAITQGDAVQPSWSPSGARIADWALVAGGHRAIFTVPAPRRAPLPVTEDAATDWCPVWSPDGRYLYFSSDRGGNMNLWRVRIEEQTGKPLADPEPVTAGVGTIIGLPSISRDARRLVYSSLVDV